MTSLKLLNIVGVLRLPAVEVSKGCVHLFDYLQIDRKWNAVAFNIVAPLVNNLNIESFMYAIPNIGRRNGEGLRKIGHSPKVSELLLGVKFPERKNMRGVVV